MCKCVSTLVHEKYEASLPKYRLDKLKKYWLETFKNILYFKYCHSLEIFRSNWFFNKLSVAIIMPNFL